MSDVTIAEMTAELKMRAPHVVLLGAGASRAALPHGDAEGRRLPLMGDFSDVVPIGELLDRAAIEYRGRNFEELFSSICEEPALAQVRNQLERTIYDYFASLSLPQHPTLYDHLILSLRRKDVIATFNWDPFLMQAVRRNRLRETEIPRILFLHGNVAAGYCRRDGVHGPRGAICSRCSGRFEPYPLLYPVTAKSYADHPAIADAWGMAEASMKSAFWVTVFGYSAPATDAAAVQLLLDGWGGSEARKYEEFEIVDVRPESELVASWDRFIFESHYEVHTSVYDSWLFNHPRRTGEAYINSYLEARFIDANPIPKDASFEDLWKWCQPLLDRERQET